ncbi:hypothetical protein GCM10009678_85440 [Actinomadura kijaniata]
MTLSGRRAALRPEPNVVRMETTFPRTRVLRGSAAGLALCALAFTLSDLVNQEYSPLAEAISAFVNASAGWLVTLGLVAFSAGGAALAALVPGGAGRWLLAGFAVCAAVAAVFPADPPGDWADRSRSDGVHGLAAWAGLLTLLAAIMLLTRRWRRDPAWRSRAGALRACAWAAGIGLALFAAALVDRMMITHSAPLGLAERLAIGADLAWLLVAATGPHRGPRR